MHTLNLGCIFITLRESRAAINDLDVILHGCMLQIIYTMVFHVTRLNNLALHIRLFNPFNSKNRGINITSITFIYVILFHFQLYLHYVINGRRLMYYLRPREHKFHTVQIQTAQQSPNWKYKKRIHSYWNIHKMCLVSCNLITHYNSPYPTYFIKHSKVFKVLFYYFQQVCTSLKQYQALYDLNLFYCS